MSGDERASRIEVWLTTAGTIAGALAALGGFVYLIGGMVMWLRFKTADIPADQGVAVMSKEQLFVIGLRLLVLPLLITGTIAVLLADRATKGRHGASTLVRRLALAAALLAAALLLVWSFAVAGWPSGLAVLLDAVVLAGGVAGAIAARQWVDRRRGESRLPRWLAPVTLAAAAGLTFVLCLAVPSLRVEELDRRLVIACAAVIAMLLPAAAIVWRRKLPRPSGLRVAAALAAGSAVAGWSVVLGSPWWVALLLGAIVLVAAAWLGRWERLVIWIGGVAAVVAWSATLAAPWSSRLAIVLGVVVVAGTLAAGAILLRDSERSGLGLRRWWLAPALVVVAVGLIVPWSFASATWPIGLGMVVGVWLWRRPRLERSDYSDAERRRMLRYMATTAVLAAAVVSIGRQLDEPVQLLHATVSFKEGGADAEGVYLNSSGDVVYIGDAEGTIDAIPRSEVRQVAVGPPAERAPSPSLLSRIVPGDLRFAVRPLEMWCDGQKYGWLEADRVCETQPEVYWRTEAHHRDMDRLGMPIRVRCPLEPDEVCRGWVLFRSERKYEHGTDGLPRPVIPDPVRFAVGGGKIREFCATLTAGQLELLSRSAGSSGVADLEATLADDAKGETVFRREYYGLHVEKRRMRHVAPTASDCVPRLTFAASEIEGGVALEIAARPRARGITPFHVRGSVIVQAARLDLASRPRSLGEHALDDGAASLKVHLPPGDWRISARYRSVTRIAYDYPVYTGKVTVSSPRRAARAASP